MRPLPTFTDVLEASTRIKPYTRRTPVVNSSSFDELAGAEVFFKCENLQRTGAFKIRGASNAVWGLDAEIAKRGVATHSSGNHGAALAAAASARGIPCWVVAPDNASETKIENMRQYGAKLVRCRPGLANRENELEKVLEKTGATMVHPYDDARVIAGQGTATLELFEDESRLDVLLVPVGGGGLVSGALLVVKALSPETRVIGVEPEGADDAWQSLQSGRRVILDNPGTIADGLRASLGELNFAIIKEHIDDIVTVSDAEIIMAAQSVLQTLQLRIEPSSATVVAALLNGKLDAGNLRVGAILTGGNVASD